MGKRTVVRAREALLSVRSRLEFNETIYEEHYKLWWSAESCLLV